MAICTAFHTLPVVQVRAGQSSQPQPVGEIPHQKRHGVRAQALRPSLDRALPPFNSLTRMAMDSLLAPILVVLTTAVIQSIFGVGVLLFGTPWLMVMGLGFAHALWILLPVSLTISCLQVAAGRRSVHWQTARGVALWTLPSIALSLWITTVMRLPVEMIVAAVVSLVAVMDLSATVRSAIVRMTSYRRSYLVFMGLIHGASNLGGSLLTALAYAKFREKEVARSTIAIGYALFAAIQLLTLWTTRAVGAPGVRMTAGTMALGALIFMVVERCTHGHVNAARYRSGLTVLLACTGLMLIIRATFL